MNSLYKALKEKPFLCSATAIALAICGGGAFQGSIEVSAVVGWFFWATGTAVQIYVDRLAIREARANIAMHREIRRTLLKEQPKILRDIDGDRP